MGLFSQLFFWGESPTHKFEQPESGDFWADSWDKHPTIKPRCDYLVFNLFGNAQNEQLRFSIYGPPTGQNRVFTLYRKRYL